MKTFLQPLKKFFKATSLFYFVKITAIAIDYQQKDFSEMIITNLNKILLSDQQPQDISNKIDIFLGKKYHPTFLDYQPLNESNEDNFFFHATAFIEQVCFVNQNRLEPLNNLITKQNVILTEAASLNFYTLNTGAILGCGKNEKYSHQQLILNALKKKLQLISLFNTNPKTKAFSSANANLETILEKLNLCTKLLYLAVIADNFSHLLKINNLTPTTSLIIADALSPIFAEEVGSVKKINTALSKQEQDCLDFMLETLWKSLYSFSSKLIKNLNNPESTLLKKLKNLSSSCRKIIKSSNSKSKKFP